MVDTYKGGKPRFRFLSGDNDWRSYGGKSISQRFNNGEFDYWLVLELINLYDACGEHEAKEMGGQYCVELSVVSPTQTHDTGQYEAAIESCGIQDLRDLTDEREVEILHSYGTKAVIYSGIGNNYSRLLKEARHEAYSTVNFMFGSRMDQPQNAIGATGWDFVKGDILRPLREVPADNEGTNIGILRKMHTGDSKGILGS